MNALEMPPTLPPARREEELSKQTRALVDIVRIQNPQVLKNQLLNDIGNRPTTEQHRIEQGIEVATEIHHGQTRLTGAPYIVHPLHVARTLHALHPDISTDGLIVALNHDTLEDAADYWQARSLLKKQLGEKIVRGVNAMSKKKVVNGKPKKVSDQIYYQRLKQADKRYPDLMLVTQKVGADRRDNLVDPLEIPDKPLPNILNPAEVIVYASQQALTPRRLKRIRQQAQKLREKREKTIRSTRDSLLPQLGIQTGDPLYELSKRTIDLAEQTLSPRFSITTWEQAQK